jgi:hypothetical protein
VDVAEGHCVKKINQTHKSKDYIQISSYVEAKEKKS